METFRRQFTLEAVAALENLAKDLQSADGFSDSKRRDAFRTLHTIKGSAQTFGYTAASRLAHELETLLSAEKTADNLFLEGVELLIKSLTEKDFELSEKQAEKFRAASPLAAKTLGGAEDFSSEIPAEIYAQTSPREKDAVHSAIRSGRNLYCLEMGFEPATFADELINLREILSAAGEIIATFPSAKFNLAGKIGFQILAAGSEEIERIAEKNKAKIVWNFTAADFSTDVSGVLAQVVRHGKLIAKKFNKRIAIKTETDETALSPQRLKLVFDVLLHLVRNAVDHAIESEGEIKIDLRSEEDNLRLTVADNGRGLDLERIKAKAIEKNLISADEVLTARQIMDFIFLPEFSTALKVTEISGRGIGLDAVKDAVEKAGGKISVEIQTGKGTTFEIFLPL